MSRRKRPPRRSRTALRLLQTICREWRRALGHRAGHRRERRS